MEDSKVRWMQQKDKHTHKVISKVTQFNFGSINYCDAPNPTKNKIFKRLGTSRTTVKQTYTGFLKGSLSLFTPYSAIPISKTEPIS